MECALLVLKAIEDSAGAGLPAGWLNVRGLCLHALCVHMSTEAFKDVCPYLCVCVCVNMRASMCLSMCVSISCCAGLSALGPGTRWHVLAGKPWKAYTWAPCNNGHHATMGNNGHHATD